MELILPDILVDKMRNKLPGYRVVQSLREGSARTGVFKLESKGQFYYLKIFQRRSRFEPEVHAYQNWMAVIRPYCPELVMVLDNSSRSVFGLVVTDLNGIVMRDCLINEEQLALCYKKAGELTRRLQDSFTNEYFGLPAIDGSPIEDSWSCPIEYYTTQLSGFVSEIKKLDQFDGMLERLYAWSLDHVKLLQDEVAVPVSYDSTPGNWIVGEHGDFKGFIDFENMLWGIRYDSFGILYERYFLDNPKYAQYFFEGYGTDIIDDNYVKLKLALIKASFASLMIGLKSSNQRWRNLGRRMLETISNEKFLTSNDSHSI